MSKNNKELRLDLNEGQTPIITKKIIEKVSSKSDWYRYAREIDLENLKKNTSERLEVAPHNLVFTNGTYHGLDILLNFLVADGEDVILPVPTFAFYPKFEKYRKIIFKKVRYGEKLNFPVAQILAAINNKTKLIYLVNPNNPIGVCATINELEIVIKAAKTKNIYVIVDEAYAEFGAESVVSLIKKYQNLIVLRSFSKIGLSGLKLGVAVANEKLAKKIEDMRGDTYNVNKASIMLISNVLSKPEQIFTYVNDINNTKEKLTEFLLSRHVTVFPSKTNFITAKFYKSAELAERLKEKGVLVKDLSHYPDISRWLKGFLRISVPQSKDLPRLIKVLTQVMDEFKAES